MKVCLRLSLLLLLFLGVSSCENESRTDTFYYDETGCADLWWVDFNDTITPSAYEEVVRAYLQDERIEMYSFQTYYDSTVTQLCFACHCKTGTVVRVEVEPGKKNKMRVLGFYE